MANPNEIPASKEPLMAGCQQEPCSPSSTPETDDLWAKHDGLTPALAAELLVLAAKLERERDYARRVLRFILDECDWETQRGDFGGGGDSRIGPAIRAILPENSIDDESPPREKP